MKKRALITGFTGQDGSYLAELLLEEGYDVYGLVRRTSHDALGRVAHLVDQVQLVEGDLSDSASIDVAIKESQPHEVYNLGAQSYVATSWNQPILTADVTGVGAARVLTAIRNHREDAKFYQASSSEMWGNPGKPPPHNEETKFHPRSPYAVAKVYAHHLTINFRESFDMFACAGICCNHEGPRRGQEFVTRKIARAVARISKGLQESLALGNLEARRDWGHARDYVRAMWLMLQQDAPDDYVIATGNAHSVQDFVMRAFDIVGISDWANYVRVDSKFIRPAETMHLCGDYSKAARALGWEPQITFDGLVEEMVRSELEVLA